MKDLQRSNERDIMSLLPGSQEGLAQSIAQDMKVLPGYQEDPLQRMYKALESEMSMARYMASMIPPEMKKGTDVDLTGLDCVHYQEKEYWVKEDHMEIQDEEGNLTFENFEGEEVEPVLVREIP